MHSQFYLLYQIIGWVGVYWALILSVMAQPLSLYTHVELAFGAVLVGSATLYSHLVRTGFKRWFANSDTHWQLLYMLLQAITGAALAGMLLFGSVLLFAHWGIIDPVAPNRRMQLFQMVFWPNSINMLVALVLWSALYLSLIKARQLKEAKNALASSQLDALVKQLNPHFLFNMLNNIRALILEDTDRARDSLARLADMLRYSLQDNQHSQVTLAEELNIVEEYIALCKIQYEDRLNLNTHIECDPNAIMVPRMLLQLCIENAIKHGIASLPEGGMIELEVQIKQNELVIQMRNPVKQQDHPRAGKSANTGIGLSNIQRRLSLLYPEKTSSGRKLPQVCFATRFDDQHSHIGEATTDIRMQVILAEEGAA